MKFCALALITHQWEPAEKLDNPIIFPNGTTISLIPDWLKGENFTFGLSLSNREELESLSKYIFKYEYESDDQLQYLRTTETPFDKAKGEIIKTCLSLWLTNPSAMTFSLVINAKYFRDSWVPSETEIHQDIYSHPNDQSNKVSNNDFVNASKHLSIINNNWKGVLSLSLNALHIALKQQRWETRYLLLWIILESLFGPKSPNEITYRLSTRLANFLGNNKDEKIELYEKAKLGYKWRSRTVHGLRLDKLKSDQSGELLFEAENLVRNALIKIISNEELIKRFNGPNREEFLDSLLFH